MSIRTPQTIRMIQKMDRNFMQGRLRNYFSCQCGKKYQTFPALYLHFKRVHKIKISTKVTQELCTIDSSETSRVFTYYYSQNNVKLKTSFNHFRNQTITKNILQNVFEQFIDENSKVLTVSCTTQWVMTELKNYLATLKTGVLDNFQYKIIEEMPFHLNDFAVMKEKQLKEVGIYGEGCRILLTLGKWLNRKNYSEYVLVPYDEKQQTSNE